MNDPITSRVQKSPFLKKTAAWARKEGKSETGGLNAKGVASYRKENPGSKLQTAVTTPPSKLDPNSKATNADFFNYIKDKLEFDQLIWEFGDDESPDWVHVSYSLGNNRMRILKAIKENGRTKYIDITNE